MQLSLVLSVAGLTLPFSTSTAPQTGPPPGYYDTVDDTDATTLRATLHPVIDDHTRFPYTSGATDTWNILELADEDPNNSSNILDVYRNASYPKQGGGNAFYQREHTWPNSYGFPNDGSTNYPFTDCHQLFLCDGSYNGARSNKPFRNCNAGCSEFVTDINNGNGGGSGIYPGNSNWTEGSFTNGTWEIWGERRGDVARAMFYMDIRYEGGTHGVTGVSEPDLILTDDQSLIAASNTGSNESVAYMGIRSVLYQWHLDDPSTPWRWRATIRSPASRATATPSSITPNGPTRSTARRRWSHRGHRGSTSSTTTTPAPTWASSSRSPAPPA